MGGRASFEFPSGSTDPSPASILLVEDDDTIRALGAEVLGTAGYHVLPARDASEAEQLAAGLGRLDALVTDVVMPGLSGLELSARLSRTFGGLRTLFCSGYPDEVIARRGPMPEGAALLAKPFTPDELRAAVDALLRDRARRDV